MRCQVCRAASDRVRPPGTGARLKPAQLPRGKDAVGVPAPAPLGDRGVPVPERDSLAPAVTVCSRLRRL